MKDSVALVNSTKYGVAEHGIRKSLVDECLLNRVREIEIGILKDLISVCNRYNLKVVMMYGSLLGVIRGDSMISGDDDIDVAMPRVDYDRLMNLARDNKLWGDKYYLQTPLNDNCFYGGYCKLRKSDTTALHPQNWWVDCNEGIGIDIFPLDYGFVNARREKRKRRKIRFLQRLLYAKNYGYFREFKDMSMLKWKAYKYLGKLYTKQQLVDRFDKVLVSSDICNVGDVNTISSKIPYGIYTHYSNNGCGRFFSVEAFSELIEAVYEGIPVKIPKGWDSILTELYGCGYLVPEIKEDDRTFHGYYVTDIPFDQYKRRFVGLCRPIPEMNRRVVLIGDMGIAEQFKKRHNLKNNIIYIDSCDGKDDLCNRVRTEYISNDYVVICAYDVRGIEQKLRDVGINDYYVFWYSRDWMLLESIVPMSDLK